MEKENEQKMPRRKFLQVGGSVLAGGTIVGLAGMLFHKRLVVQDVPYGANIVTPQPDIPTSPYRRVTSIEIPEEISTFELAENKLVAATAQTVYVYNETGELERKFSRFENEISYEDNRISYGENLRGTAYLNGSLYLLFPTHIEVYTIDGRKLREWVACDEQSDYCEIAVAPDGVFVTDAANKNIHKYTLDGTFVKFIQSPDGFVIPSYSFGITYSDGVLYCSNSGRHRVEKYTTDGEYLGSFGEAGAGVGRFCGCCNPVHLSHTATGDIITSEKGIPRISCYSPDGRFQSLLLDTKVLGGGHTAYGVKVKGDKLFVAGANRIDTYRYDQTAVAQTACAACVVNCPLRQGITV
ncbi:MAG: hypothetical protein LBM61_01195 [Prevotellaceae bacterium]|jgi:hypothetical protein|nr:hypothetical protein [Prevotellaceae bacterium]